MKQAQTGQQRMENGKVFPMLLKMSIPPIVSMLIQSLYNIVDSMYVAKMGQDAITAVSLAFPLQNIVLAMGVGFGISTNAAIARRLGARKPEQAGNIAAHSILLTVLHAVIFVFVGLFLTGPFLQMFTDDPQILAWGQDYAVVVVCLSFWQLYYILFEKMFQSMGRMLVPMVIQIIGAVCNIILDPILIFGKYGFPELGVRGAAVATVFSQAVACVLSIILFVKLNNTFKISFRGFRFKLKTISQLYAITFPSAIMMALPSFLVSILNGILISVSQVSVAVFGVYYKVQTFVYMPGTGVIQSMRPIVSYHYGAKLYKRMFQVIRAALILNVSIMAIGTLLFMAAPGQILGLFEADAEMIQIGVETFRLISLGFMVSGIAIIIGCSFESLGMGFKSLSITLTRQLLIIPLLSMLLVPYFGLTGVWITFPIAETLAAIVAMILFRMTKRKLISEELPSAPQKQIGKTLENPA